MTPARRVALACAAVAVAVSGVAVIASISIRQWRPSALVRMSGSEPMAALARETDPSFAFVPPEGHYDGVYFYAIARDPLARGEAHHLIDRAAYRYGHAGYGWLAWLASGGRAPAVPAALLGLGLAGAAVAAAAASLLSRELGWSGWGGLLVALNPGIVYATTVDTSEPVGLAVLALALVAWLRAKHGRAGAWLVAACLMKEPFLLVPAGLAVWEGIEWARGRRGPDVGRRLAALAAGPVAFGIWYLYLRGRFGVWPFTQEARDFLTAPFAGWVETFRLAAGLGVQGFDRMQLGTASVPLLAAIGGALALGAVRAVRPRTPIDPVFLLLALLMFCLNWLALLYPKDLIRELAAPLALLPAVLAGRRPVPRAERPPAAAPVAP